MYTRSSRFTARAQTETGETVGPGTYDGDATLLKAKQSPKRQKQAPFLTVAERVSAFDQWAKQSAASPDAYEPYAASPRSKKAVPFAASKNPRFADPSERSPGPGVYTTQSPMFKKKHTQRAPQHEIFSGIKWTRKSVPPSIPYGAQCAGYEENNVGEMKLRDSDATPSPAARMLAHGSLTRINAGTNFAKSKSGRKLWAEAKTPSPDVYNVEEAWKVYKDKRVVGNTVDDRDTLRFGSLVINDAKRKGVPGPGSYSMPADRSGVKHAPTLASRVRRLVTPTANPFNSASPTYEQTPGPGAYDSAETAFAKKQALVSTKAFSSTSGRFEQHGKDKAPGPGRYGGGHSSLVKASKSQAGAAFGSIADRGAGGKAKQIPGPGSYELSGSLLHKRAESGAKKVLHQFTYSPDNDAASAAFGSQAERFDSRGANGPSPASYDVVEAHQRLTQKTVAQPVSPRSVHKFREDEIMPIHEYTPGPAEYNAEPSEDYMAMTHPSSSFISTASRFSNLGGKDRPAPNHYSPKPDLVHKTFNVTLEGDHYVTAKVVARPAEAVHKKVKPASPPRHPSLPVAPSASVASSLATTSTAAVNRAATTVGVEVSIEPMLSM
ncbi:Sperm-tail PG-rich repeat-containing protein 2 [Sorochytrium milnesiophthora]